MTQTEKNDNKKVEDNNRVTRFYAVLTVVAVIIMIVAAYITYGYQAKTIVISFDNVIAKINDKNNSVSVGADLSLVPNDDVIEDILNDTIPNVCDDITDDEDIQKKCDKDPLSCLKEYEINMILVQDLPHQNHLFIKLTTGKNNEHLYTVVIDLANNNQVIHAEGKIDDDRCRDVVEEGNNGDASNLKPGQDPESSDFIDVKPKE